MKIINTLEIDKFGNCYDGTNMYAWNISRLQNTINICWYPEIVNLAKEIMEKNKKY